MTTLRDLQSTQQKISKRVDYLAALALPIFCVGVTFIVLLYLGRAFWLQVFEPLVILGIGVLGVSILLHGLSRLFNYMRPEFVFPKAVSHGGSGRTLVIQPTKPVSDPFLIKLTPDCMEIRCDLLMGDDLYYPPIEELEGYIRVPWEAVEVLLTLNNSTRYSSSRTGSVRRFAVKLKDGQLICIFREFNGAPIFSKKEFELVEFVNQYVTCEVVDELL